MERNISSSNEEMFYLLILFISNPTVASCKRSFYISFVLLIEALQTSHYSRYSNNLLHNNSFFVLFKYCILRFSIDFVLLERKLKQKECFHSVELLNEIFEENQTRYFSGENFTRNSNKYSMLNCAVLVR